MNKKRPEWILGSVLLFLAGVVFVPKYLKKFSGEIYKKSNGRTHFQVAGPKIVKKDTKMEE